MLFRGSSITCKVPKTAPHLRHLFYSHHSFTTSSYRHPGSRFTCSFVYFCVVIEPRLRGTIAELDSSRLRHFMCAVMSGLYAGQHARQPGEPCMQQLLRYLPSKPCFVFVSLHISAALAFLLPLLLTLSCTSLPVPT